MAKKDPSQAPAESTVHYKKRTGQVNLKNLKTSVERVLNKYQQEGPFNAKMFNHLMKEEEPGLTAKLGKLTAAEKRAIIPTGFSSFSTKFPWALKIASSQGFLGDKEEDRRKEFHSPQGEVFYGLKGSGVYKETGAYPDASKKGVSRSRAPAYRGDPPSWRGGGKIKKNYAKGGGVRPTSY